MANFIRRKFIPLTDEDFDNEKAKMQKKITKFSVFVIVALLVVTIIIGSIFYFNYKNNSLRMFVKAASNSFDSGGFAYQVTTSINGETYMEYDGQMKFDHSRQQIISVYDAKYQDYEYKAIVASRDDFAIKGNFYGGKWTVENYTTTALDFFDFYGDFREYKFNAAAATRFLGNTETFNEEQLEQSFNDIVKKLSNPVSINNILHQNIEEKDNTKIVTFKPQMDKVMNIIVDNIAPAYSSAKDYTRFKEMVNEKQQNFKNVNATFMYKINENDCLTDILLNYSVNGDTYTIKVKLDKFGQATPVVPDDFWAAANSQI